jgi:hypothetical protein
MSRENLESMGHNLHGDVPAQDLELAEELLEMESHFNSHIDVYGAALCARVMVCISHDYYEIGDDDKGYELLQKAEKICPGYFENEIKLDIEQDPGFAYLVESLTEKILLVARSIMDSK